VALGQNVPKNLDKLSPWGWVGQPPQKIMILSKDFLVLAASFNMILAENGIEPLTLNEIKDWGINDWGEGKCYPMHQVCEMANDYINFFHCHSQTISEENRNAWRHAV